MWANGCKYSREIEPSLKQYFKHAMTSSLDTCNFCINLTIKDFKNMNTGFSGMKRPATLLFRATTPAKQIVPHPSFYTQCSPLHSNLMLDSWRLFNRNSATTGGYITKTSVGDEEALISQSCCITLTCKIIIGTETNYFLLTHRNREVTHSHTKQICTANTVYLWPFDAIFQRF